MTDAALPLLGCNGDAAAEVRRLWSAAARIDVAVGDPRRLWRLLGSEGACGPRPVRLIAAAPPRGQPPLNWEYLWLPGGPAPEFILFYRTGRDFPDCALILSGMGVEAWWTWHQRPAVLQRLRERFAQLRGRAGTGKPAVAAPSGAAAKPVRRAWAIREPRGSAIDRAEIVTASELYRRVLAAHYSNAVGDDTAARPESAPALAVHQTRAYERALSIIERFGGVIVADAVGLGKTYIGLRLLERAVADGGRGLVVAPAALREQWARELAYLAPLVKQEAERDAIALEADNLDLWVGESTPVGLVSMEALGRPGFAAAAYRGADMVLVDEAHNFRNPATKRYRVLMDLARHAKLALLTATPINNTLRDLQHLIDLFAAPGAFRHLGVPDYRRAFQAAEDGRGHVDAIISACVVRRTRRCLRATYGGVRLPHAANGDSGELRFPRRAAPRAVEYDLRGTYGELLAGLEGWFEQLSFPSLVATELSHEGAARSGDTASLLKIILLKRLESSVEAFRRSIAQQLAWCRTALDAIAAGRLLTRPDYRAGFRGSSDDPGGQLALFELMLPAPTLGARAIDDFRGRLRNDLDLLARIHGSLSTVKPGDDRKLRQLTELLDGPLAGRKILLFTEFRDTARYLYRQLRDRPHVAEIDSAGARLGLEPAARLEVIERFAPLSNGLPEPHPRERVDLLIATDVLSEGLNLQDASVVVSYDLPWNPVRLMQRVGRIDRLGAIADIVELHHFVPARDLDRLLGLMDRLRRKLATIESAIGMDHPTLANGYGADGDVDRVRRLALDPQEYDRLEEDIEGPLDPEEQAYIDHVSLLAGQRIPPSGTDRAAATCVVSAPNRRALHCEEGEARGDEPCAVAYWRLAAGEESRGLWLTCDPRTGYVTEDQAGALTAFREAIGLPAAAVDDRAVNVVRRSCARYVRLVAAQLQAARIAGDALRPGLPQCRIAAWLSRHYESASDRLTADQRRLIDRLVDGLACRFTMAVERDLMEVADRLPERATWKTMERLAAQLEPIIESRNAPVEMQEIGVLVLAPPS